MPVALLGWDAWCGRLGANPANFAIRTTGLLALIFLVLSLAVTPASRITGWGWLGPFRRMLGLYAFFHAALHFFLYFWFDRSASVRDTASEIWLRPYLLVGAVGLGLMVPLAATSTDRMIRRLGPARWKSLHRLAYVAAAAGALHFYLLVKADVTRPAAFAAALGVLLGYRLVAHYLRLRADARKYRTAGPAAPSRPTFWAGKLRVARVFVETPEVRTFRLASGTGPGLPFDFAPGQYLNLSLVIDGVRVRRSYTIASSPTRVGYCEITVKREDKGLSSRHLHDAVRAGDWIDVQAPAGRFTFTGAEAGSVVLIAGGVGITPLMSKVRYLTDLSWPGEIYLIFSAKTEDEIIFRSELDALRVRHPNLHVTVTLTRSARPDWAGERGRVTPDLLTRVVPEIASRRVHVCGPTEMTDSTREMLLGLGVPAGSVHVESFTSPSRSAAGPVVQATADRSPVPIEGAADATVTFARSGATTLASTNRTVLEVAEASGVAINYDCRAGICGQCKVKLLSGRVVMDAEDALDAADRAAGVILSCQARCVDHVIVDA
ncbi:ferric reductase-like transmembrane domain-containing protein [Frigoriglobus tundricola]|uniref:ferric reductase-like transmembrane domain-containing protein n=1 Tax=Frigoriglobus tundricola TaxID=2774151 RepID=UPI00148EE229|nr:ferric reductase-like transmembrane domain-containing protein [Frigoriglobus tundricola]